jgi:hypothetical protein
MYEPVFNSVLVQIDDKDAEWGSGNDESMLGKSYSKGKVIQISDVLYPSGNAEQLNSAGIKEITPFINKLKGKSIMWNEGTEAGTTFEFDGKLFGMIYWWSIRGVLVDA